MGLPVKLHEWSWPFNILCFPIISNQSGSNLINLKFHANMSESVKEEETLQVSVVPNGIPILKTQKLFQIKQYPPKIILLSTQKANNNWNKLNFNMR